MMLFFLSGMKQETFFFFFYIFCFFGRGSGKYFLLSFFLQSDTRRAVRLQKKLDPRFERGDHAPCYILPFYLSKPGQFEDLA